MDAGDHETLQERQENELQALKAIYMEDICDLRCNDAWKVHRPPEVQITLTPQQSMSGQNEVNVQVDLHIKCGQFYPEEIPEISFKNCKGLSKQNIAELSDEIIALAQTLKGEVMILELAQHVQKYLHSHNHPRFKSFYEEMLSNKKRQAEEEAKELERQQQILKIQEERERKVIEEEILKKQEALKEEVRLRKEQVKQLASTDLYSQSVQHYPGIISRERSQSVESTNSNHSQSSHYPPINRRRRRHGTLLSEERIEFCNHRGTLLIQFNNKGERNIQRGRCMGHSSRGSVSFAGLDMSTGDLVTITEWVLKWKHSGHRLNTQDLDPVRKEIEGYSKQLANIEHEVSSLMRLHHPGLVRYLGMKYHLEKDKIIVHVLQEFVPGANLSHFIIDGLPLETDLLRYYANGILDCLAYLHRNSVVHKDLRDTNIFIENYGNGIVKISDYSIDKRLADLHSQVSQIPLEEIFSPSLGRGAKKADIYRLGVILLSLYKGEIVNQTIPQIPTSLPQELGDFLEKCLLKNDQERWSADQLLQHSFLKTPVIRSPSPRKMETCHDQQKEEAIEEPTPDIPYILALPSLNGQSRLQNEFEVLKWLGKGGFGDVLKVRNKLDGRIYAIKRILLNPHSKQLNRKITREVKLLSRLNHENVVRYFYSWIETTCVESSSQGMSTTDSSVTSNTTDGSNKKPSSIFGASDDIERLAPAKVENSVEMSISIDCGSQHVSEDESSSDEDEEDVFATSFLLHSPDSADSIIFERDGDESNRIGQESSKESRGKEMLDSSSTLDEVPKLIQFMYIQMEFCEKSTLRSAIDVGLHQDLERVWRLFREIIEGLAHIHQQGMIHRDLKPVNIFLDLNDHVKIGDFGLATTDIIQRAHLSDCATPNLMESKFNVEKDASKSDPLGDGSFTGRVGTALYVAPELGSATQKTIYSQKVDIYSLGIIFFEMCYYPLPTTMERVKVLGNLRLPHILLPLDFDEENHQQQIAIIRWLLNHDPSFRPTSLELLQSEHLPPPQMEEAELQEMLRHTINNPQSKQYKHMISALFRQEASTAADVTYDIDLHKGSFNVRTNLTHKFVRDTAIKVFQRHGAIHVITPILLPKSHFYKQSELCVNLLDHGGGVVTLPYDLRVSFARYILRNNITSLKRYCISRVFRERKVFGCHPRELFECAFDIVTPHPGSRIAEAEILTVVWEVTMEFPELQNRSQMFRLNHTSLIKAILIYCGIPEEKHNDVCCVISDVKAECLTKFQMQTKLMNLCLSDQTVILLCSFIEVEGSFSKISDALKPIVKRKGQASALAKQALYELEAVIMYAETLGLKAQILITPGLVYCLHQFSGMFFHFVCELKKKRRKGGLEVLAAGGRYDKLVSGMNLSQKAFPSKETHPSAVGVSFAVEKIVSAILEDEEFHPPTFYDVLVCSIGQDPMLKEKGNILKELWACGIRAYAQYEISQSVEDLQELCRETGIYIVILKDTDLGNVRVRSWEKDRFVDKKLPVAELPEFLQKSITNKLDATETSSIGLSRSDSSKSCVSNDLSHATSGSNFIITFLVEKLITNNRRRYEGQIASHVSSVLQCLSPKIVVEILAVELNSHAIKTIAFHLEPDGSENDFKNCIGTIIEKLVKHKKYLTKVMDQLYELRFEKKCPVILLYGLSDNSYKVLW